jgi:hypothetical protein
MTRPLLRIVAFLALSSPLLAYRTAPPKYVVVDLTWKDAKTGQSRTVQGQLWFADLPHVGPDGKVIGLGRTDHFDGIKWVVPKNPGDIWIARGTNSNPAAFVLHDYYGEREILLAFGSIDVSKIDELKMDAVMAEKTEEIDSKQKTGSASRDRTMALAADLGLTTGDEDSAMNTAVASSVTRDGTAVAGTGPSPLRFASSTPLGIKSIPVGDLQKIVFLNAEKDMPREKYRGRFVGYSNQAVGDAGRVQVVAATFFGGPASERFSTGHILNDGTITMSAILHDLSFVDQKLVSVLGNDPPIDAYPVVTNKDSKGRTIVVFQRDTPCLVAFSKDLQQLNGIVRLPWGCGSISDAIAGPDDAMYISGMCGPHAGTLMENLPQKATVDNPDAVEAAAKSKVAPGGDGFVVRIAADRKKVDWIVRFKHAGVRIFLRPDGKIVCRRGDTLFFIGTEGAPTEGPKLDITGSKMAVDPNTGAMYFGGSYRSGTGLEPYVCPYLYKVDPDGKIVWTAYSWTGPIAGVEQHRLVSDSSITRIRVSEDGNLAITGWSDGGNTVLSHQPYDMRKGAPSGGFCSSLWGADGSTVRIGHIIHMDSNTMEVDYCTTYVGYKPTCDIPTLINIYDFYPLPNGDVALTGGGWTGFVETHDAWTKPWYIDHLTNEFALAHGGPFFTVFKRGFAAPRMSTITPGMGGAQLSGRGKMLLMYCSATDTPGTIIKRPWQKKHGGGSDAYVALIDTQGPANPPVIPEKTWGKTKTPAAAKKDL